MEIFIKGLNGQEVKAKIRIPKKRYGNDGCVIAVTKSNGTKICEVIGPNDPRLILPITPPARKK